MPDPTDKRIEELWQYIPPYTAPNHPPQVKVITTTNTGDTPMTEEDPDLLAGDNLDGLRGRNPYSPMSERFRLTELLESARYQNNLLVQKCRELEKENFHLAANQCHAGYAGEYGHHRCAEIDRLTKERDEARRLYCEEWAFTIELERGEAGHPPDLAAEKGWDCYKATPPHYDYLQDLG